jgi:cation:H+ antiporter
LAFGLYAGRAGIAISLILIASYLLYLLRMLRLQRSEPEIDEMPEKRSWITAFFYTFGGIVALIFGAELFVSGGIALARLSGWSEAFIGLTIIAIGTSLPEIVSIGASILHKRGDIALGNVMGSNLFNLLIALGGAGLFGSLVIDMELVLLPMTLMVLVSVMLLIFSYQEKVISTKWGVVFIGFYLCFLTLESMMSAA